MINENDMFEDAVGCNELMNFDASMEISDLPDKHLIQNINSENSLCGTINYNLKRKHEETEVNNFNDPNEFLEKPNPTNLKMKLAQIPLARVRNIMKLDKDLPLLGHGVVFLISKSTELFIRTLVQDSYSSTLQNKKKTVQMKDIETAITQAHNYCFLEGAL